MGGYQHFLLDYQTGRRVLSLRYKQRGFSLIELIIGLVIIGILLAMGAPAFSSWIQNAQVRTAAQSLVDGLQLARAEAVRLNAPVRFNLSDTSGAGLVDWDVCSSASSPCPAANILQSRSNAEGSVNARVGVYETDDGLPHTNYATVVTAGEELPGSITFNGLGRVVTASNCADNNITRIDVTNAVAPTARRMVVEVSCPGGQIRMCDPALPSTDPQGC